MTWYKFYKYISVILLLVASCILWPYVIADFIKYFFTLSNKYFATPLFTWKQYLVIGFLATGLKILMTNPYHANEKTEGDVTTQMATKILTPWFVLLIGWGFTHLIIKIVIGA